MFRTLLGISWRWFFGAVFLSQFPSFAKEVLHGDATEPDGFDYPLRLAEARGFALGQGIIRMSAINATGMTSDLAIFPVLDPCDMRATSATLHLRCRLSVSWCR